YPGRGAVLGRTDASTSDYYSFTLAAGESATLALSGLASGDVTLALENSAGTTLAIGCTGADNLSEVINNFVGTAAGTYFVRVIGSNPDGTDYSLVVTRNAEFNTGPNGSIATAQPLIGPEVGGKRWAVGAVVPGAQYAASPISYTFEDISATGHA